MSRAAVLREKASFGFWWLCIAAVALGWMWLGALLVRELGADSVARTGWVGVPGTVVVSHCASEIIDQETATEWTDCDGWFTPADGSAPARTVGMSNAGGTIAPGTSVDVRLVGDLAYQQSWFRAGMGAAGALLFGALGGIPLAAVVVSLYSTTPLADRSPLPPGVAVAAFVTIAVTGEFLLTLLLDHWHLL
ncbi:hypothetical protein ACFQY4_40900 [Catellatospora bangladeshensis]|uniref:hypothetical protein n=1 Tax=Catellatospora bangladeshensis TaxID=310355 RepID=UPI001943AE8B|nr:hypothetical protein [Catellatospora bangladeshensis]